MTTRTNPKPMATSATTDAASGEPGVLSDITGGAAGDIAEAIAGLATTAAPAPCRKRFSRQ